MSIHPSGLRGEDAKRELFDPALAQMDEVEMAIQVNGKVRDRMRVAADASEEAVHAGAIQRPIIQQFINGATIRQVIIVPGKLVNIVIG